MIRSLSLVLAVVFAPILHAQRMPELVRDIGSGNLASSAPRSFVSDGRTAYFFARDDSGVELWKTDGTNDGTAMISDVGPSRLPAYDGEVAPNPVLSGDYLYFWATGESNGVRYVYLYRSDGTPSGTINLVPGNGYEPSRIRERRVVPFGTRGAIFMNGANNFLYVTDGTPEGTRPYAEAFPRQGTLTGSGGLAYFVQSFELWRTDGTKAGTRAVATIMKTNAEVKQVIDAAGSLFILMARGSREYDLWRSDGTASGTSRVALIEQGNRRMLGDPRMTHVGSTVYLVLPYLDFDSSSSVTDIWRIDGTSFTKVTTVKGSFGSFDLLTASSRQFFFTVDLDRQHHIVYSDGTAAGTGFAGSLDAFLFAATATSDRLFFYADGGSGRGLWTAGNAPASLRQLRANGPVYQFVATTSFAAVGDTVVTSFTDADHGEELWISDGTVAGTTMLRNIAADGGSNDSIPLRPPPVRLSDSILFPALTTEFGLEPWISDGTREGTRLLADIAPGSESSYPTSFARLGDHKAVFIAEDRVHGRELWSTDETTGSTQIVREINPGNVSSLGYVDGQTISLGSRVLLLDETYPDTDLWVTAGTEDSTQKLADFYSPFVRFAPIVFKGFAYFTTPLGLWKSDGTPQGTTLVDHEGVVVGVAGSKLFFTTGNDSVGKELWVTDGTAKGTRRLYNLSSWEIYAPPTWYADVNGVLFFAVNDDVHGIEPWRSDGTPEGTYLIKDIAPGGSSSHVDMVEETNTAAAYAGRAYFIADDGVHGAELWESDGTAAGTRMVKDIAAGAASSYPAPMKAMAGRLYFSANDFEHGRELWVLTGATARMVADINPGNASSAPRDFTLLKRSMLFFATHQETGRELWTLPLGASNDASIQR